MLRGGEVNVPHAHTLLPTILSRALHAYYHTVSHHTRAHTHARTHAGVSVEEPEGALYLFPRLMLPPAAVAAAAAAGKTPDTFYCLQLVDETGVVVVPGSGFGQVRLATGGSCMYMLLVCGH